MPHDYSSTQYHRVASSAPFASLLPSYGLGCGGSLEGLRRFFAFFFFFFFFFFLAPPQSLAVLSSSLLSASRAFAFVPLHFPIVGH